MKSLLEAFKDLGLNTTLHGCRHLVEENRHWIERVIWVIVQAVALWGMVTSTLDVYQEYLSTPMVTSLTSNQYPAWMVPFPAVALCNINKLSKRKVEQVAEEIVAQSEKNVTKEEIMSSLQKIGQIYDTGPIVYSGLQDLEYLLKSYETNLTKLLHRLAPSCDELLLRCQWKGRNASCSELFRQIETYHGICCAFNAVNGTGKRPQTLHSTGYRLGLTVLVDPDPNDYFYPVIPTFGTQVLIFKSSNYPDSPIGIIEYVVPKQRETFFTIDVLSKYSTSELKRFEPSSRGCFFKDEALSNYTYTNCIAGCMTSAILEICHCIPYYFQNRGNNKVCELTDIPCLARNRDKFQYSTQVDNPDVCGHCLPACTDTWYDVQSSFATISLAQMQAPFQILDEIDVNENQTLIHLYYQTIDTTLFKQDVLSTRTELVSNIGGICSLFNGFSFLSLVEILYFLTIRWFLIKRKNSQRPTTPTEPVPGEPVPYWSELGVQHIGMQQGELRMNESIGVRRGWEMRKFILSRRIENLSKYKDG